MHEYLLIWFISSPELIHPMPTKPGIVVVHQVWDVSSLLSSTVAFPHFSLVLLGSTAMATGASLSMLSFTLLPSLLEYHSLCLN